MGAYTASQSEVATLWLVQVQICRSAVLMARSSANGNVILRSDGSRANLPFCPGAERGRVPIVSCGSQPPTNHESTLRDGLVVRIENLRLRGLRRVVLGSGRR